MNAQNQTSQKSGQTNGASEWEKMAGKTQRGDDTTTKNPGTKNPTTQEMPDDSSSEKKRY
jgi:hypothetical protein